MARIIREFVRAVSSDSRQAVKALKALKPSAVSSASRSLLQQFASGIAQVLRTGALDTRSQLLEILQDLFDDRTVVERVFHPDILLSLSDAVLDEQLLSVDRKVAMYNLLAFSGNPATRKQLQGAADEEPRLFEALQKLGERFGKLDYVPTQEMVGEHLLICDRVLSRSHPEAMERARTSWPAELRSLMTLQRGDNFALRCREVMNAVNATNLYISSFPLKQVFYVNYWSKVGHEQELGKVAWLDLGKDLMSFFIDKVGGDNDATTTLVSVPYTDISIVRYISRAVSCVVTMRSLGGNLAHMVTPPPAGSAPRIRFFLQGNAQLMRDLSTVLNRRLAEHGVANSADPKPSAKCSEVSMKDLNADILSEVVDRERRMLGGTPGSASNSASPNAQAKTPVTPAAPNNSVIQKSNCDERPSKSMKEPRSVEPTKPPTQMNATATKPQPQMALFPRSPPATYSGRNRRAAKAGRAALKDVTNFWASSSSPPTPTFSPPQAPQPATTKRSGRASFQSPIGQRPSKKPNTKPPIVASTSPNYDNIDEDVDEPEADTSNETIDSSPITPLNGPPQSESLIQSAAKRLLGADYSSSPRQHRSHAAASRQTAQRPQAAATTASTRRPQPGPKLRSQPELEPEAEPQAEPEPEPEPKSVSKPSRPANKRRRTSSPPTSRAVAAWRQDNETESISESSQQSSNDGFGTPDSRAAGGLEDIERLLLSSPDGGEDDEPMLRLLMKEMQLISKDREQRKQKRKMQRTADTAVQQVQGFVTVWSEQCLLTVDKPLESLLARVDKALTQASQQADKLDEFSRQLEGKAGQLSTAVAEFRESETQFRKRASELTAGLSVENSAFATRLVQLQSTVITKTKKATVTNTRRKHAAGKAPQRALRLLQVLDR